MTDLSAERRRFPTGAAVARRLGLRTVLNVPLLRKGKAIGVITVRRSEIKRFTDKQVSLRSDGGVQYKDLVRVVDRLKAAGVTSVGLVTAPEP